MPVKNWGKLTIVGKHVFNKLFDHMINNPDLYQHPEAPRIDEKHFRTIAWNAAWMASDMASRGEKHLLKYLVREIRGYDRYEDENVPG